MGGRIYSIFFIAFPSGAVFAAILQILIVPHIGYLAMFEILAVLSLISLFILIAFFRLKRPIYKEEIVTYSCLNSEAPENSFYPLTESLSSNTYDTKT